MEMKKRSAIAALSLIVVLGSLLALRHHNPAVVHAQSVTYQAVIASADTASSINYVGEDGNGDYLYSYQMTWPTSFGTSSYAVSCTAEVSGGSYSSIPVSVDSRT